MSIIINLQNIVAVRKMQGDCCCVWDVYGDTAVHDVVWASLRF